ncbi:MAG: DUF547 domain-containing protein [Saprospiraceae bacterium]
MKKINFFIALAAFFVLAACTNPTPNSSADTTTAEEMGQKMEKEAAISIEKAVEEVATPEESPSTEIVEEVAEPATTEVMEKPKAGTPQAVKVNKATTKKEKRIAEKSTPMPKQVEQKVNTTVKETAAKVVTATSTVSTTSSPVTTVNVNQKETTPAPKVEKEVAPVIAKPDHGLWNSILQKNVSSSGKVNYAGIKTQKAQLEKYLTDLESNTPQSDWSRNEKLAYWINVYNAYTVKLIVDNYPTKSITDLEGGKPWDKKWIKIAGKTYSLNNIENDLIRPRFKEPRIHFAVNCAAQSCPPILNKAWTADNLSRYFNQQAKSFINNSKYNQISANSVTVSKIFDWYGEDFGNLIDYLNKFSDTKISSDATVNYKEYDWNLNN